MQSVLIKMKDIERWHNQNAVNLQHRDKLQTKDKRLKVSFVRRLDCITIHSERMTCMFCVHDCVVSLEWKKVSEMSVVHWPSQIPKIIELLEYRDIMSYVRMQSQVKVIFWCTWCPLSMILPTTLFFNWHLYHCTYSISVWIHNAPSYYWLYILLYYNTSAVIMHCFKAM